MKVRKLLALMMGVLLLLSLAGCAASSKAEMGNAMPDDYLSKEDSYTDNTATLPENRKLIQTVNMYAETEDLDAVLQQINSRIAELKGYVESSNVQNGSAYSGRRYRSANLTIRIPAKDLEAFLDKVDDISNIVSSRKTVEDVTLSYVATESRMKALQAEEARLLELMTKAETLNDLLTVEKRLTDVRTELEQVASALRVFDNQVDYATVHLSIDEVKEYTEVTEPETVWQRIGSGFKKSLKGVWNFLTELFVFLIVALPYAVMLAVPPLLIIFLIRLRIRRRRNSKNK